MVDQLQSILKALTAGKNLPIYQDEYYPQRQDDTRSWVMPGIGFNPGMKPPYLHVNDVAGTQSTMPAYNPSFAQRFSDEDNAAWKENDKQLIQPGSPMLNGLVEEGLMKRKQGVWSPAQHPNMYGPDKPL